MIAVVPNNSQNCLSSRVSASIVIVAVINILVKAFLGIFRPSLILGTPCCVPVFSELPDKPPWRPLARCRW